MSAPQGWYADPSDVSAERWWDGDAWSIHTRPLPAREPLPVAVPVPAVPVIDLEPLPVLEPLTRPQPPARLEPLHGQRHPAAETLPQLEPLPVLAPLPRLEPLPVGAGAQYVGGAAGAAAHPIASLAPTPTVVEERIAYVAPPQVSAEPLAYASVVATLGHAPDSYDASYGGGSSRFGGGTATSSFGGGTSSFGQFGGAGQVTRLGASPNGWTPELNGATSAVSRRRGPKPATLVLATAVVAALTAVAVFVVLPRYRDHQAILTASSTAAILPHVPPRTVAGEKRTTVPGLDTAALARGFTDDGATWAWVAPYRGKTFTTFYLASALPTSEQPDAVRALSNAEAAAGLIAQVSEGMVSASGGTISTGAATEYDDKVIGKTWCVPVSARGQGGGLCIWTSGREMLAVMMLPGNEVSTAKRTLKALLEMKASTARFGS